MSKKQTDKHNILVGEIFSSKKEALKSLNKHKKKRKKEDFYTDFSELNTDFML